MAIAKGDGLKSYTRLVYFAKTPDSPEPYTTSLLCESITPTRQMPPKFILKPEPECPSGYQSFTNPKQKVVRGTTFCFASQHQGDRYSKFIKLIKF